MTWEARPFSAHPSFPWRDEASCRACVGRRRPLHPVARGVLSEGERVEGASRAKTDACLTDLGSFGLAGPPESSGTRKSEAGCVVAEKGKHFPGLWTDVDDDDDAGAHARCCPARRRAARQGPTPRVVRAPQRAGRRSCRVARGLCPRRKPQADCRLRASAVTRIILIYLRPRPGESPPPHPERVLRSLRALTGPRRPTGLMMDHV